MRLPASFVVAFWKHLHFICLSYFGEMSLSLRRKRIERLAWIRAMVQTFELIDLYLNTSSSISLWNIESRGVQSLFTPVYIRSLWAFIHFTILQYLIRVPGSRRLCSCLVWTMMFWLILRSNWLRATISQSLKSVPRFTQKFILLSEASQFAANFSAVAIVIRSLVRCAARLCHRIYCFFVPTLASATVEQNSQLPFSFVHYFQSYQILADQRARHPWFLSTICLTCLRSLN